MNSTESFTCARCQKDVTCPNPRLSWRIPQDAICVQCKKENYAAARKKAIEEYKALSVEERLALLEGFFFEGKSLPSFFYRPSEFRF